MDKLQEIKTILTENKEQLKKKFPIKSLGIFGSLTRDDFTKDSDVDILVEFEKPVGLEFIDLAEELEKLLNRKVDLVSKKAVKPKMLEFISKELVYV
jgi:predicted nucleotidyltransferase